MVSLAKTFNKAKAFKFDEKILDLFPKGPQFGF